MTNLFRYSIVCVILCSAGIAVAQGTPRVADPGEADTMLMIDTSKTAIPERFRHIDHKKKEADLSARRRPTFSFADSVTARFGSERYNQKPGVDRSVFRNAGDYFRYSPQFFVQSYQESPMRTTVAPFGLPGNRITWAPNGHVVTPFEHVPVHDGMVDTEDLPTTTDYSTFVIPGPIGLLYGGQEASATLITRPMPLNNTDAQSALMVDKGWDATSMTRGRVDKLYGDGRRVDLSIAYRKTAGRVLGRYDNAYHYTGATYLPVGSRSAIEADGWLYNRKGAIAVNPDSNGTTIPRYRFERHLNLSFVRFDSTRTSRSEIGYRHDRQGTHIDSLYHDRFDLIAHTLTTKREWTAGRTLLRGIAGFQTTQYRNRTGANDRTTSDVSFAALKSIGYWQSAALVGSRYTKSHKTLPYALATILRQRTNSFLHLSIGYTERAPTQHELFLPYNISTIQSSGVYADSGNPNLASEKQLIATAYGEYGTFDNAIGVSVASGRIRDAIDWVRFSSVSSVTHSPRNVTLTFTDIAVFSRLRITDFARFSAGGAYKKVNRSDNRPRYYSPDYLGYSGLELHWFWKPKLIHFYAYGELVYTGKYVGYIDTSMGERVVANARLSFRMAQFRFNFDFRNTIGRDFSARDGLGLNGRYFSYGFVWNFVN